MARKKKGCPAAPGKSEEILQAVVLADSFQHRFTPITFEKPKALLPLVNVPMIEYTLECLASADVQDVYILGHSHSAQIEAFLNESSWSCDDSMAIHFVHVDNVYGPGDALRHLDNLDVIRSDPFVLISAEVVTNFDLGAAIKQHRDRSAKDSNNIMTSIFKKASPAHRIRSLEDDLVVGLSPESGQLFMYQSAREPSGLGVDAARFQSEADFAVRYDLLDCGIDICSPSVLEMFTDNFDFQDLRAHFLKSLLESDIMGAQVYCHVVEAGYAARVKDLRTYDSVSKDIIQRWSYPITPENNCFGDSEFKFCRNNVYKESNVKVARSASVGPNTVLGAHTSIGENSNISDCTIGRNCTIGSNVSLSGCYLWDDCIIGDRCIVDRAILCNGAKLEEDVNVNRGAVLSFGVRVGRGHSVAPFTLLTTVCALSEDAEWGDDGESDDNDSVSASSSTGADQLAFDPAAVGSGGCGRVFRHSEKLEADDFNVFLNSIAPDTDELRRWTEENAEDSRSISDGEQSDAEPVHAPDFLEEICDTLHRGETDDLDMESVILEMKSLKLSYNIGDIKEFSAAVLTGLFKCVDPQPVTGLTKAALQSVQRLCRKWNALVTRFARTEPDQLKTVFGLEKACEENEIYRPLFVHVLQLFYDLDTLSEEPILEWWHG
eukprot:959447_1